METTTRIRRLSYEESVEELARMLGGAKITQAVLENAGEMKDLAQQQKKYKIEIDKRSHNKKGYTTKCILFLFQGCWKSMDRNLQERM